jgi:hypothetical protein
VRAQRKLVALLLDSRIMQFVSNKLLYVHQLLDRDDVVGIATRYGLEGPGIEFRWRREFLHLSRPPPRPTQPPVQWVPGLSQGKGGRGVVLTAHPHILPRHTERSRAIPLLSLRAFMAYRNSETDRSVARKMRNIE